MLIVGISQNQEGNKDEVDMRLSGILFSMGWFFSFLCTAYGLLFASIDKQWLKESFLNKLVADPFNTLLAAFFFGFIASCSFVFCHHVEKAETSIDIQAQRTRTEDILPLAPSDPLRKKFLVPAEELGNKAEYYFKAAANDYEEKQFDDAIRNCQKSIDVLPTVTAYINLSGYLTYTQDHQRTEKAFAKGIELAQKNGDLKNESKFLSNRAAYFGERGQQDKILLDLNRAIELDPSNAHAHFELAIYYCEMLLTDRALEELDKAVAMYSKDEPRDLEGKGTREYNLRGLIKSKKGLFDEAIREFDKAIQANTKFYPAYNNKGIAYLGQKRLDLAITEFDKAIDLNPKFAGAYCNRGAAYASNGMLERGISDYDIALRIDPRNDQSYFMRGRIQAQMTSYDKAILDFNKAIEINPKNAKAYLFRGRVFDLNGNSDKALLDFKCAIELNPNDEEAHFHRAKTLSQKGLHDEALLDYDKAIDINPAYVDALVNRSALYISSGRLCSALSDLNSAVKINPKSAPAYNNRGAIYFHQQQFDKALSDFNEAIKLNPQHVDALFNRAKMYKSIGQSSKAAEDFKRACSLGIVDACKEYDLLKNSAQS